MPREAENRVFTILVRTSDACSNDSRSNDRSKRSNRICCRKQQVFRIRFCVQMKLSGILMARLPDFTSYFLIWPSFGQILHNKCPNRICKNLCKWSCIWPDSMRVWTRLTVLFLIFCKNTRNLTKSDSMRVWMETYCARPHFLHKYKKLNQIRF